MTFDDIADRMIEWAVAEPRVRALWIEGSAPAAIRRPYSALQLHLAADEPSFREIVPELEGILGRILGASTLGVSETRRLATEYALRAGTLDFTLIAEQSSLLAKRPRAEVAPLVDKTGNLTHVMDFSARRR